jgi:hypothetical protein
MDEDWRKIDRGLFESPDGRWRISNPWKLKTELRHRWLVAERRSDGVGWHLLDGDHATLHDARAYVAGLDDGVVAASGSAREHGRR